MYKVKLAVIVAAMLFIFSTLIPSFGDTEVGSGTVQTVSGGGKSPNGDEFGKVGSVSGPTTDAAIDYEQSPSRTVSSVYTAPAPRPTIVVKKTNIYKTYVYSGHKSHRKVYREVESWHPASCKFVEKHDQLVLNKVKKYSDRQLEKHLKTQHQTVPNLPPSSPFDQMGMMGIGINDIGWITLVMLILGLLWKYHADILNRFNNRRRPTPKPEIEPSIVNTARGWYGSHPVGSSQAEVVVLPGFSRVYLEKQVKNLTTGGDYTSRVEAEDSDTLRYRIRYQNRGLTPQSADRVLIKDTLEEQVIYVAGSARFFINNSDHPIDCPEEAADEIIKQLHKGNVLRMSDIPGAPASLPKSSLYLTYDTEVGDAEDIGDIGEEFVRIPTPPAPPTGPVAEPPVQPAVQPAPQETVKEVKVKKPEETPTEMINRLIKEVLGGQYGIPHNLWSYMEGLTSEDEIRRNLEKYNQVRGELIYIDRELNRRYDYRKIKYLAGQVTLGLTTIEQAKTEYRGTVPTTTVDQTVIAEDAVSGLIAGLEESDEGDA